MHHPHPDSKLYGRVEPRQTVELKQFPHRRSQRSMQFAPAGPASGARRRTRPRTQRSRRAVYQNLVPPAKPRPPAPRAHFFPAVTLNLKNITSPSSTK